MKVWELVHSYVPALEAGVRALRREVADAERNFQFTTAALRQHELVQLEKLADWASTLHGEELPAAELPDSMSHDDGEQL